MSRPSPFRIHAALFGVAVLFSANYVILKLAMRQFAPLSFAGQERTTTTRLFGIALAAVGALLVVGGEGLHGSTRSLLGVLMLFVNCLSYALYLVMTKPILARLGAQRVVTLLFAYGAVLMLPVSGWSLLHEHWRNDGAYTSPHQHLF